MNRERITRADAIELLERAPLLELMSRANEIREKLHPGRRVTFVVDTNPNYTNVCITDCTFCSFYRRPGAPDAYLHPPEEIAERVRAAQLAGATTVLIQGGHHPDITLQYYEELIFEIQARADGIHIHPFSPSELLHLSAVAKIGLEDILRKLWHWGIRTLPGGGAEILVDSVRRKISPKKTTAGEWLNCMRQAHAIGFKTSATMTYGHVESVADVIDHLLCLRELQDSTHGFYAFIPWSFKPGASPLARRVLMERLPSYYLRIIAISRIVLDNFPHIQASWFGEGERAGQLALRAGADDFGGVLIEENVLRMASHRKASSIASVIEMIRSAGFSPAQRTTLYQVLTEYGDGQSSSSSPLPHVTDRTEFRPLHFVKGLQYEP